MCSGRGSVLRQGKYRQMISNLKATTSVTIATDARLTAPSRHCRDRQDIRIDRRLANTPRRIGSTARHLPSRAILAAAALFAIATPAAAETTQVPGTNYTFPDGSRGFELNVSLPAGDTTLTSDGLLLPAVLVGFNPQPDPPGTPPTFLSLVDPTAAMLSNNSTGLGYTFVLSFLNLLPGGCDPTTIAQPNSDGHTALSCTGTLGSENNVTVDVALTFSGPGAVTTWSSFNPQPDPPGDVAGFEVSFQGALGENADPSVTLGISINGTAGDLSVPEPGTLSLIGTALIGLAAWRRRRRQP
jgi:PEP-CTERM motif